MYEGYEESNGQKQSSTQFVIDQNESRVTTKQVRSKRSLTSDTIA